MEQTETSWFIRKFVTSSVSSFEDLELLKIETNTNFEMLHKELRHAMLNRSVHLRTANQIIPLIIHMHLILPLKIYNGLIFQFPHFLIKLSMKLLLYANSEISKLLFQGYLTCY